jgi:hypothetical protein
MTASNSQKYQNGFTHDDKPEEIQIPVPWGHISGMIINIAFFPY